MAALRREAAARILENHLSESTGFYSPPVSRLARTLRVAGGGVGDLIRSTGLPVESGSEIAGGYVDILGAGAFPSAWIAVASDDLGRLGRFLRIAHKGGAGAVAASARFERMKVFLAVEAILLGCEGRWASAAKRGRGDILPPVGTALICRSEDREKFAVVGSDRLVIDLPCESIFVAGLRALKALRRIYGEGWCQDIGTFRAVLEGARKKTDQAAGALVRKPAVGADFRAGATGVEFLGAGWRPAGLAEACETRRASGIHIFRDVRFLDFWRDGLWFRDRRALCLARAQSFESSHPQDRVLLAVKGLNYTGWTPEDVSTKPEAGEEWMVLPMLSPNAFHAIVRLLPGLRLTVIGYLAGHSRTSDAGVFEQLLRCQAAGECLDRMGVVAPQIERLLQNQPLSVHADRPMDVCAELEVARLSANRDEEVLLITKTPLVQIWKKRFGKFRAAFAVVWTILRGAARAQAVPDLRHVAKDVLKVPDTVTDHLAETMPEADPVAAYAALGQAERAVAGLHRDSSPKARRNRERYPLVILVQQCLHLLAWTFAGRLCVPRILSEWLGKRLRLVAIVPLDSSAPGPLAIRRRSRRPRVGDWHSWEAYPGLFLNEAGEQRVPVDLSQLLHGVRGALAPASGWLANKCSETNELVLSLMRQHGHVANFELADLPRLARGPDRELLDHLDGRLAVRCLQSVANGDELMSAWVADLAAACAQLKREGSEKAEELPDATYSRLLSVLGDVEGIVAAAFDRARSFPGPKMPELYFGYDTLGGVFEPENTSHSNASEYHEEMGGGQAAAMGGEGPLEDSILRLLQVEDVPVKGLIRALECWEENEGAGFGETIEGLLGDLEGEIDFLPRELRELSRRNYRRLLAEWHDLPPADNA